MDLVNIGFLRARVSQLLRKSTARFMLALDETRANRERESG
jgi:hypothetical protein